MTLLMALISYSLSAVFFKSLNLIKSVSMSFHVHSTSLHKKSSKIVNASREKSIEMIY